MRLAIPLLLCSLPLSVIAAGAQVPTTAASAASAASPLTRTVLQTQALSASPALDGVLVRAELAVGGAAPRHTHPGEEFVYVIEGTATFALAGRPVLTIKAGDSFVIPPDTPHVATNIGTVPLKLLSTYIVPRGKPLATPAP